VSHKIQFGTDTVVIAIHINLTDRRYLATAQEARVPFPALPDILSSSGSATGSTQPREDK
jgi:hypothetical protein